MEFYKSKVIQVIYKFSSSFSRKSISDIRSEINVLTPCISVLQIKFNDVVRGVNDVHRKSFMFFTDSPKVNVNYIKSGKIKSSMSSQDIFLIRPTKWMSHRPWRFRNKVD